MKVLFLNFSRVFLVWRKLFYFIPLEVYKDEGFLLSFSCLSRENVLTSENNSANNPLVSTLWPGHRTWCSSSSIFHFSPFPFMHPQAVSKQRLRWLQFEDNLLQLLVAALATVWAGNGLLLTLMEEQVISRPKADQPIKVANTRSQAKVWGIGDKLYIQIDTYTVF